MPVPGLLIVAPAVVDNGFRIKNTAAAAAGFTVRLAAVGLTVGFGASVIVALTIWGPAVVSEMVPCATPLPFVRPAGCVTFALVLELEIEIVAPATGLPAASLA